jgi:hypothetical protein
MHLGSCSIAICSASFTAVHRLVCFVSPAVDLVLNEVLELKDDSNLVTTLSRPKLGCQDRVYARIGFLIPAQDCLAKK